MGLRYKWPKVSPIRDDSAVRFCLATISNLAVSKAHQPRVVAYTLSAIKPWFPATLLAIGT